MDNDGARTEACGALGVGWRENGRLASASFSRVSSDHEEAMAGGGGRSSWEAMTTGERAMVVMREPWLVREREAGERQG